MTRAIQTTPRDVLMAILHSAMDAEVHQDSENMNIMDFGWREDGMHVWVIDGPPENGDAIEFVVSIGAAA